MRRFMAVLLLMALIPSAAVQAEDSNKALALHAFADHLQGGTTGPDGRKVLDVEPGGQAEVSMPPQTSGSTSRSPVSTAYVLGESLVVRRSDKEDIANGNLAAGTAEASSFTRNVEILALGVAIDVRGIRAISAVDCDGPSSPEEAAAGSSIASLVINGEPHAVEDPNQFSTSVDIPGTGGRVEIEALNVVPSTSGTGWTTTGLRIRTFTATPARVTNELVLGTARTAIDCA